LKSEVKFIFRKPHDSGNYSIEYLFDKILGSFDDWQHISKFTTRFVSRGILSRLLVCADVFLNRGRINVITGDINFVTLFLPKNSVVLVIHDCGYLYDKKGISKWLQEIFWYRLPVRRAAKVIAVSDATKADLIKITKSDPTKIKIIPNFIDPIFQKRDKKILGKLPLLLQIGQAENKNLERIICAIKGLHVQISIIGKISEKNLNLLEEHRINYVNSVNLSDIEIYEEYIRSDILLFPSTYEGFGLPILEAQAVGRPVITSNTTSMPWVAGEGAMIVDPYSIESIRSGIEILLADAGLRNALRNKGFENVKRFQFERVVKMYQAVVLETLNAK